MILNRAGKFLAEILSMHPKSFWVTQYTTDPNLLQSLSFLISGHKSFSMRSREELFLGLDLAQLQLHAQSLELT